LIFMNISDNIIRFLIFFFEEDRRVEKETVVFSREKGEIKGY
jgi:hypothetical protein